MSIANIRYPDGQDFPLGCASINTTSAIEISYLEGARSNIQAQIDSIDPNPIFLTPPGDILVVSPENGIISSTNYGAGVTVNQNLAFNNDVKIGSLAIANDAITGSITTTELSYLEGASANIQAQIDSIGVPTTLTPAGDMVVASVTGSPITSSGYGSKVTINQDLGLGSLTIHSNGGTGTLTTTELSYVEGVTANIQAQLDSIGAPIVLTPPGDIVVVSATNSPISSTDYTSPTITINKNAHFIDNVVIGSVTIVPDATTGSITGTELGYSAGLTANIQAQLDSLGVPVVLSPPGDMVVASSTGSPITSNGYGSSVTISQNLTLHGSLFESDAPANIITPSANSLHAFEVSDSIGTQQFNIDCINKITSVAGQNSLDKFDIYNQSGSKIIQVDTSNGRLYLNGISLNIPYAVQTYCNTNVLVSTYPTFTQIPFDSTPFHVGIPFGSNAFTVPVAGLYSISMSVNFVLGTSIAASRNFWFNFYVNGVPKTQEYGVVSATTFTFITTIFTGQFQYNYVTPLQAGTLITYQTAVGAGTGTVNVQNAYMSLVKIA